MLDVLRHGGRAKRTSVEVLFAGMIWRQVSGRRGREKQRLFSAQNDL